MNNNRTSINGSINFNALLRSFESIKVKLPVIAFNRKWKMSREYDKKNEYTNSVAY